MRTPRLRSLAALPLLVALAPIDEAKACSCAFGLDLLAPEDGDTDVPLDTRVWIGQSEDAPFDGELVLFATDDPDAVLTSPATLVTEQGKLSLLTPLEPLRPLTTYEVWDCEAEDCRAVVSRFTTGTQSTGEAPPVPELLDQDHDRSGSLGLICPRSKDIELHTRHDGLLVIERDSLADLDATRVDDLDSALVITADEVFELDEGGCIGGWPGGRRVDVRLGALDLAGNFSGFGDTEVLDIGCGCRSDAASRTPPAALWLACLLFPALRRRPPRSRESAPRSTPRSSTDP